MSTTYFASDLHLGHRRILEFGRDFPDLETHNKTIIEAINDTVKPTDKLFLLGDLAFNSEFWRLSALHCENIIVVLGNHDYPSKVHLIQEALPNVKLAGCLEDRWKGFGKVLITHMPIHPSQLEYRAKLNIHGHLHSHTIPDPRYVNVSMEQLESWKPISKEKIISQTSKIKV